MVRHLSSAISGIYFKPAYTGGCTTVSQIQGFSPQIFYKITKVDTSQRAIKETKRRVKRLIDAFGGKTLDYLSEFLIESYKQDRLKQRVKQSTIVGSFLLGVSERMEADTVCWCFLWRKGMDKTVTGIALAFSDSYILLWVLDRKRKQKSV